MRGVNLIFATFVGLVACINGAPAATARGGVSRATVTPTTSRTPVVINSSRTAATSRAAVNGATSRATAANRATGGNASRATVATTTSRAATGNLASRAITKALSGATSRRGNGVGAVLARSGSSMPGAGTGARPTGNDYISVVVDKDLMTCGNMALYLSLAGGDNDTLFFKLKNGSALPDVSTFFANMANDNCSISGIFDAQDEEYISSNGEQQGTLVGGETYYLKAQKGSSSGGDTAAAAVMASYNSLNNAETLRSGTVNGIEYEVVRMGDDEMCIAFRIFNGEYHPMGTVSCDVTVEELASEAINVSF